VPAVFFARVGGERRVNKGDGHRDMEKQIAICTKKFRGNALRTELADENEMRFTADSKNYSK
jgi:hypothetical protein